MKQYGNFKQGKPQPSDLTLKMLDLERRNPAIKILREKLGLRLDYGVDTETGEYQNNEDFLKELQNLKPTNNVNDQNNNTENKKNDLWKGRKFGKEKK